MISYGRQTIEQDDIEAVASTLRSDWLTQGPKVQEFEEALASFCGARYAVAVSNGTAALHLACLAAGLKAGLSAITSPITFLASANCIAYCGATPGFSDIQPDTITLDPQALRPLLNEKTKAIIPVHFAGHPCDLEEIQGLSRKQGALIIEDAAHALGATYRGSVIGSCRYSDMTVFSFHPVKHITMGEGGAILTNDVSLYEHLILHRNHGMTRNPRLLKRPQGDWYYEQHSLGFNYRVTDFQCALGISQLKKLSRFLKRRREIVDKYHLALSSVEEVILPIEKPYVSSAWHIYCVRLSNPSLRRVVFQEMRRLGIGVQVHYIPVYTQPFYKETFGTSEGLCPNAERYYERAITLPLHPSMSDTDVNFVSDTFKKILKNSIVNT